MPAINKMNISDTITNITYQCKSFPVFSGSIRHTYKKHESNYCHFFHF